ncbi:hypothetical protein [Sphaerochaeta sp. S2]|nr:hypothetical protein [Sphaerochaeta sp. S2]MBJ2355510.1 hypothetical protein [Sphaerochaeta sp. S2]
MKTIPETVLRAGLRLVCADPEKNLPKLVSWAQPIARPLYTSDAATN